MWENLSRLLRGVLGCYLYDLHGVYCPVCGGTRATVTLMRGEIVRSGAYHPLPIFLAITLLLFVFFWMRFLLHRGKKPSAKTVLVFIYMGMGITLINWIVKNYILLGLGIDILRRLDRGL